MGCSYIYGNAGRCSNSILQQFGLCHDNQFPPPGSGAPYHPRRSPSSCSHSCGSPAAALARMQVAASRPRGHTSLGLGSVLWISGLARPAYVSRHLPLELCDATLGLIIIALFTLHVAIFDLVYYCALAGTTMALLTPDLWESFPSLSTVQFFFAHGFVVSAALYLVWSGQARPRPGSVGRTMLILNIYAAAVGTFDLIFRTNYMYLLAKPESASLLDFLGPWPWYILASEGVAFGLFLLLYLPFRQSASKVR